MLTSTPKLTYWDGTSWSKKEASAASIATGSFASGDVFWSPHHQSWVAMFMGEAATGSTFYVSISTSGNEWGPYTEAQKIFDPPWDQGIFNYGGHAYSQFFDTDAKDVLVSWTVSGAYTQMAKVTFDPWYRVDSVGGPMRFGCYLLNAERGNLFCFRLALSRWDIWVDTFYIYINTHFSTTRGVVGSITVPSPKSTAFHVLQGFHHQHMALKGESSQAQR